MLEYVRNVLKVTGKLLTEVIKSVAEPFNSSKNEENDRNEKE